VGETSCCYARSDKYWVTDPQGIAWEQFHTLGDIPVFSEKTPAAATAACCGGNTARGKRVGVAVNPASPASCC
jgi:lactoylglutathione lyase